MFDRDLDLKLIRHSHFWQVRIFSLWITRVYPLRWAGKTKPGSLTIWLGKRLLANNYGPLRSR